MGDAGSNPAPTSKIHHMIKKFIQRLRHLYKWLPIIWKDYDYDHAFIEYMLKHKLQSMYDRFSDPEKTQVNWETEHALRALKALRICITILERRRSTFYIDLWDDENEKLTDEIMIKIVSTEDRDWKLLWKLMDKFMLYWWD